MMSQDATPNDAILKDLEIQWKDHHHMRDQTWKTLTNSLLLFLGVVGLELKGIDNTVMILAYILVLVAGLFGFFVSLHHRLRQKEKFAYIRKYQDILGLTLIKKTIQYQLKQTKVYHKFVGAINTGIFIAIIHISITIIPISLFLFHFFR